MKKVLCFYLENCPYCLQAQKAMDDLMNENSQYKDIHVEWIEETENPDIIDSYDYYATPSMFVDEKKIYEAHLFETYEECKLHVQEVLDLALEKNKKLYISDLDGTLLHNDETLSDYTIQVINDLVDKGMMFSYATARSYNTAKKVTQCLNVDIPLIVYNGVSIRDNMTGHIIISNIFEHIDALLDDLLNHGMQPIVYSYVDGVERFSYVKDKINSLTLDFIKTRTGDFRNHPVDDVKQLYYGDIFYITCIDEEAKLKPMYQKYHQRYHCIYSKDVYSSSMWLEIMPQNTSKAHAIQQLKDYLHCEYVVVFGDGKNDIEMFEMADECYAVENADEELKAIATDIIASNNNDGVARWLKKEF